jgi:hypothetical protein
MKTDSSVTAEEVLRVLNVDPPSRSSYRGFLERYAVGAHLEAPADLIRSILELDSLETPQFGERSRFISNYLVREPTMVAPSLSSEEGWRLPETITREESLPIGDALISAHLRRFLDEWLDTGRRPDGSEGPRDRVISIAQDGCLAIHKYLEDNPMTFTPILGPHGFSLEVAQPRWDVRGARDFFTVQIQDALRLFVGVLASDWKDCLCKCRYSACGRYFIHPKPRSSYKHGTFCRPDHASHAAAKESVRLSRNRAKQKLIEAAARELVKRKIANPQWRGDSDIKVHVAAQLCLVIAAENLDVYRQEVRLNWITRHWLAIEQKRIELSGPKGAEGQR